MITQLELFEILNYNPYTGKFTRVISIGKTKAGDIAGTLNILVNL